MCLGGDKQSMVFERVVGKLGPSDSYIGLLFVMTKLCFLMYFSMCLLC